MFGKLTLDAFHHSSMIIVFANVIMIGTGLAVVAALTYYRKWGYLYREWFTTVDHKKIGVIYIVIAMIFLLRGFIDASMVRAQQASAGPGMEGYLEAAHFAELFTGHGTMMIFFMAMPFLVGLMNIAIPLQIGARDVSFPLLNAISVWLTAAAGALVMISLLVGSFSEAGWSGYTPFSGLAHSPGPGVDYWIWALQISGISTTLTGVNFVTTILKKRAPGMTLMRMPMFTWTVLCTSILIVVSFPALTAALALLALDRSAGTHFFTSIMGGDQMLYINMFWLWGHPEVYILVLPAFGIFSEVVTTYCNKRLFGYTSMVWATMAIAFLSFGVWVHHFYTMGQDPLRNSIFGIATMIIAIPTGVKIYDWIWTMFRGRIEYKLPMLWTLGFLITFVMGGMSGVLLAIPGADYKMHNSLFLVAHFHNVLIPGTMFGLLAGFYYWFPKVFGFRLDEKWGRHSFWGWLVGFYVAFVPLYMLGIMGMPRRMVTYDNPAWHFWLVIAAIGAMIVAYGIFAMFMQIYVSWRDREKNADLTGDPWGGRTLEWAIPSPPPEYNFAVVPEVRDRDAFMEMKVNNRAYERPAAYEDIHMPKSTPLPIVIAALSFVFGFAYVWHIWWLAGLCVLGTVAAVIVRSFNEETEFVIPASEVEADEDAFHRRLKEGGVFEHLQYIEEYGDERTPQGKFVEPTTRATSGLPG
ncbi:cbb3-type cytochrome c oxidase subunit I [Salinisphaera sp.]|uniref:cbb3-type cytochrome c oxidase subunit I n=1 Tax=Salinisphaera sp. TaxID=1914330 RepID=UPI0025DFFB75|nr:cbb3-type cytochrome c oxidase subunit I [Salinisphaera sp.]